MHCTGKMHGGKAMNAYRKGAAAAKAGASFLDNPYPCDTNDWNSRNCGYIDNEDF